VAYLPRLPYSLITNGLFAVVFALFITRDYTGNAVLALLERSAPTVNYLLPTAWPSTLFQLLLPEGHWSILALLAPIGIALGTLRHSLTRLQTGYHFAEPILMQPPDLIPEAALADQPFSDVERTPPLRLGPTAIEDIILARTFLSAPAWSQRGWFEKWLWGWLSDREKALFELAFPNGIAIQTPWMGIFRNLILTTLAAVSAGLVSRTGEYWILSVGLFVVVCQALAQVLNTGRTFQDVLCGGVNIPLYAAHAVGYRELGRLLGKYTFVQFPLIFLFTIITSLLIAYVTEFPLADAALLGGKGSGLLLAGRWIQITLAFSAGTNDSAGFRLRSMILLVWIVAGGLSFLALAAGSLFVPHPLVAACLWGLAALNAYLFFRLYGWFYHANRFDLMNLPRR
jgi:hypothetical protein